MASGVAVWVRRLYSALVPSLGDRGVAVVPAVAVVWVDFWVLMVAVVHPVPNFCGKSRRFGVRIDYTYFTSRIAFSDRLS